MKGRDTGSPEHRKAAEYIADHFKRPGSKPGGTKGYFQPVPFRSRRIVEAQSSLALVRTAARSMPVVLGDEATFSMRIEPAPNVEAPLVFAGYGLQVPESKHDDLAGLDLKGKIVAAADRRPVDTFPGPLLAHYQNDALGISEEAPARSAPSRSRTRRARTSRGIARSWRASCRRWRLPIRRSTKRSASRWR